LKRHILKETDVFDNRIYGIVSTRPFAQLTWNLIEQLNIQFTRDSDLQSEIDNEVQFWPRYTFEDVEAETSYTLVKNRGVNSLLAPELKNVDVFLIETNHSLTFQLSLDNISKTSFVDFCFEIKDNMIKHETRQVLNLE
jgi:hypothetical protein